MKNALFTDKKRIESAELRQFFDEVADIVESSHAPLFHTDQRIDTSDVHEFFFDMGSRLESAEAEQRQIDQKLATRFNVFHLIEPDENKLSDLLADLLDPEGSHGQGEQFLRLFFEKLRLCDAQDLRRIATVRREAATHSIIKHRRRIDILIEAGALVAIENKVDSLEQPDQVKDYLEHLRQCARGRSNQTALVYLTPNGRKPSSLAETMVDELTATGALHCWSYPKELSTWLKACRQTCEAERIRCFLSDFIIYAESALRRKPESKT